ncbi:hypothetical protein B0H13DRAFT_1923240 [Mycena leptocephala]|nr:hypothetical protein B0H13DRAFT_1923240 [Mycena leptocephala]
MAIASRDQSTRVRILANGKETVLPGGTTEWIRSSQIASNRELLQSNWYESVGPASTKWPAEGLIQESGWVGGFSLNEMKGGVDTMKSVSVDFAPSSVCRILDKRRRPDDRDIDQ